MHTRASNSELVEPLPKPERTLNRRLRRQNRRVPFKQRNDPPQQPRVVYAPILNINHFRHFLITLQNLNPMDDEPMWVADHVVASTPGFAITIPETANEFAIKGNAQKMPWHTVAGDGIVGIKRRRRNPSSGGVKSLAMASARGRLKEDLESSS
ncbi:hypothetical protein Tco_0554088 [Tanacetum coccineum]